MEYAKDEILDVRYSKGINFKKSRLVKLLSKHKLFFLISIVGLVTIIGYVGLVLEFIYTLQYLGN